MQAVYFLSSDWRAAVSQGALEQQTPASSGCMEQKCISTVFQYHMQSLQCVNLWRTWFSSTPTSFSSHCKSATRNPKNIYIMHSKVWWPQSLNLNNRLFPISVFGLLTGPCGHVFQVLFLQNLVEWWILIANFSFANEMQTMQSEPRELSPHYSYK